MERITMDSQMTCICIEQHGRGGEGWKKRENPPHLVSYWWSWPVHDLHITCPSLLTVSFLRNVTFCRTSPGNGRGTVRMSSRTAGNELRQAQHNGCMHNLESRSAILKTWIELNQ